MPALTKSNVMMRTNLNLGILTLLGCIGAFVIAPSLAAQQIPEAGKGKVKVETRFYRAHAVFPAASFSTSRLPSKKTVTGSLTKIVGDYGLGGKWAFLYHLRFAYLDKSKKQASFTTFGLQDQTIGIERGLRQGDGFSDAVDLKFVLPTGSTTSVPQLGTGHFAIEPDYEMGFTHHVGKRFVYGDVSIGPRIFTNSGVTQLQTSGELGGRFFRKINVFGTVFLARTLNGRTAVGQPGVPNASEYYDLLRVGGGFEFAGWKSLRPMIAYQQGVAGQGIYAGSRLVFGFTVHFNRRPHFHRRVY